MVKKKRGLGKGLEGLIPQSVKEKQAENEQAKENIFHDEYSSSAHLRDEKQEEQNGSLLKEIPLHLIHPDREQPRKVFDEEELKDLAQSIREHGLIQPIIVVRDEGEDESYKIVAGERRWRAARIASLKTIPCIIKKMKEIDRLYEAIIENVMRSDLNPIEEAQAYRRLLDEYNVTQEELSKGIGKSRTSLTNALRLLSLNPDVQKLLIEKEISTGHAKLLLQIQDPDIQIAYADKIAESKLSVRDFEVMLQRYKNNLEKEDTQNQKSQGKQVLDFFNPYRLQMKEIQDKISSSLGAKVRVKSSQKNPHLGKIVIEYKSREEFEKIMSGFGLEFNEENQVK